MQSDARQRQARRRNRLGLAIFVVLIVAMGWLEIAQPLGLPLGRPPFSERHAGLDESLLGRAQLGAPPG